MPLENRTGNCVGWGRPSMNGGERCRWDLQLRGRRAGKEEGQGWSTVCLVYLSGEKRRCRAGGVGFVVAQRKKKKKKKKKKNEVQVVSKDQLGYGWDRVCSTEPRAVGETPTRNSSGSATRQATQLQPAQQRRDAVVYGATRAIVMASLAEPDTPGWGAENTSIHQVGLKACWSYARPGQAGSLFNILPLRSIYISASCFRESVDETRGLSLSLSRGLNQPAFTVRPVALWPAARLDPNFRRLPKGRT
ncbi:hypothetical protein GY631_3980 [Trichophyton interdigitale]|nr:hypothetical protein GY631_3980 [Trichophyton interdigitale]